MRPFRDISDVNNISRIDEIMQAIKNYAPNGSFIINTAENEYQKVLYQKFNEFGLTYDKNYTIFSMDLNPIYMYNTGYENYKGSMILVHSYTGYENTTYSFDRIFIDGINSMLINEIYPLDDDISLTYTVFEQLGRSITISGSILPSKYKPYLFRRSTPQPVAGPFEIYTSGFGQGAIRILQMNETVTSSTSITDPFELISYDTFSQRGYSFHDYKHTCNLLDDVVYKPTYSYVIGLLFDIESVYGAKRYLELQLIISLVNQDGGIGGLDIIIKHNGYTGDSTTITKYAKDFIDSESNLLCFIGANTDQERKVFDNFLVKNELLCFSFTRSKGEVIYKNVIVMNYLAHQIVSYQTLWAYDNFDNVAIVAANTTLSIDKAELTVKYANYIGKKPIAMIILNDTNYETDLKPLNNSYDSFLTITFLEDQTIDFMTQYNEDFPSESYPILISDFIFDYFDGCDNESIYKGHYAQLPYYRRNDYEINIELRDLINEYKGKDVDNLNLDMIINYNAIQFIVKARTEAKDNTATQLIQTLYNYRLDLPDGKGRIKTDNYCMSHVNIGKITSFTEVNMVFELPYPVVPREFYFLVYYYIYIFLE